MARAYGQDLRDRVVSKAETSSARRAAASFDMGAATAVRWVAQARAGQTTPHRQGRPKGSKLNVHEAFLLSLIKETPDITPEEMRERLKAEHDVVVGVGALWRFFDVRDQTFKKKPATPPSRSARTSLRRATPGSRPSPISTLNAWCSLMKPGRPPRWRGRAGKGERLRAAIPHGRRSTTTFAAGLRLSGLSGPMVLDGPMNGPAFLAHVEQVLVPTLTLSDTMIMDNLSCRKSAPVRRAIEAVGARLMCLSPYSPDFNPIEMAFSKLKALLRKAAERSRDDPWRTIARLIDAITPTECAIFFRAAGYEPE